MVDNHAYLNESATRRKLIDPLLKEAGWVVINYLGDENTPRKGFYAVTERPAGDGFADYTLFIDGVIIGIIEAKKEGRAVQEVLTQAERYAKAIKCVSFLYSVNGNQIRFWDYRDPRNTAYEISRFHTPDAIKEMLESDFDNNCKKLLLSPCNNGRDYQNEAVMAIEKAMSEKRRKMMIAMATGTGKTFMTVNLIYRLMKSGASKRVLFLVDRKILAAQAVRAFSSFEAEPGKKFDKIYEVYSQNFQKEDFEDSNDKFDPKVLPNSYLTNPKPGNAFVYVCTIQRMTMNIFGKDAYKDGNEDLPYEINDEATKLDIPIHAFDVIIADECHRGYTSQEANMWRQTIDHFDAIKVGLTATPAVHSSAYFGEPVYNYPYGQAVQDGYLVDYDAVKIKSEVRMKGVFLQEGELIKIVNPDTGIIETDKLEDSRDFDSTDIERKITSVDSNRKILEEIKKYCDIHENEYGRFPKTLIFAVHDVEFSSHADQLVKLAREVFGKGEKFVQKITGKSDKPLQKIKEFRNRDEIGVVVTVDMLSTGVDIPKIENIVFLRPVKSRILFEQILGRGTRKCEEGFNKSHFTVFDCFDGTLLDYFKNTVGMADKDPSQPTKPLEEIINNISKNKDRDYYSKVLAKRLQRFAKEMTGDLIDTIESFGIKNGNLSEFAKSLPEMIKNDFPAVIKVLTNPQFIDLLKNLKPFKPGLIIDETTNDTVISVPLSCQQYKPQDYLVEFEKYLKENKDTIDAISILFNHPKDWNRQALVELKQKLLLSKVRFTIEDLQKAHKLAYKKDLADIISMVKHAIRHDEPIYTASERVERAFEKLMAMQQFTPDQQNWIDRIKEHMKTNLTIELEDFDKMPIFEDKGGRKRAEQLFGTNLLPILNKINEAVAA